MERAVFRVFVIAVAVVLGAVAVLFGQAAVGHWTMASWDERRTPHFDLAPGVEGTWEVQWEPRWGRLRGRTLLLRSVDDDIESWPRQIDLRVRVESPEAVGSYERPDSEGWIRYDDPRASGVLGLAEPTLVRRIEWRVVSMEPAELPTQFYFLVPGDPDSEHPSLWPFFAGIALCAGAGAVGLSYYARRLRAFDVEHGLRTLPRD